MSEKLVKLEIERDIEFLYFVRNGDVWRVRRKDQSDSKMPELVQSTDVGASDAYVLYLDADGDLSRVSSGAKPDKPRRKRTTAKAKAGSTAGDAPSGKVSAG